MILSDTEISKAVHAGDIVINPFNSTQLNITSYDLTLGEEVRVYRDFVRGTPLDCTTVPDGSDRSAHGEQAIQGMLLEPVYGSPPLDVRRAARTEAWQFDHRGFVLKPRIGYLMHTRETVWTQKYNPILDGKSSIGRLFIQVHATAGYGDPGFSGQYTLEVIVQHPVRVYPGMRIAQIRFHQLSGKPSKLYDEVGHYVGEAAMGAKPSQVWKQFL